MGPEIRAAAAGIGKKAEPGGIDRKGFRRDLLADKLDRDGKDRQFAGGGLMAGGILPGEQGLVQVGKFRALAGESPDKERPVKRDGRPVEAEGVEGRLFLLPAEGDSEDGQPETEAVGGRDLPAAVLDVAD